MDELRLCQQCVCTLFTRDGIPQNVRSHHFVALHRRCIAWNRSVISESYDTTPSWINTGSIVSSRQHARLSRHRIPIYVWHPPHVSSTTYMRHLSGYSSFTCLSTTTIQVQKSYRDMNTPSWQYKDALDCRSEVQRQRSSVQSSTGKLHGHILKHNTCRPPSDAYSLQTA